MTTPFDQLAEHYGPTGKGSRKPCPDRFVNYTDGSTHETGGGVHCRLCHGLDYVLDTDNPLFKVLWEPGSNVQTSSAGVEVVWGYIPRSREVAALALLDATMGLVSYFRLEFIYSRWQWKVTVGSVDGWGDCLLDALSAALLAKEGVKTDVR